MTRTHHWPSRIAALFAVLAGAFLILGGAGHLGAILESNAGEPFDYRFVSLLTTSGILIFPGLVAIGTCYWLWMGRVWAYISCLLSATALLLYLALLLYMKTQAPEAAVGDELYIMTGIAIAYVGVLGGVFLWLQFRRQSINA